MLAIVAHPASSMATTIKSGSARAVSNPGSTRVTEGTDAAVEEVTVEVVLVRQVDALTLEPAEISALLERLLLCGVARVRSAKLRRENERRCHARGPREWCRAHHPSAIAPLLIDSKFG